MTRPKLVKAIKYCYFCALLTAFKHNNNDKKICNKCHRCVFSDYLSRISKFKTKTKATILSFATKAHAHTHTHQHTQIQMSWKLAAFLYQYILMCLRMYVSFSMSTYLKFFIFRLFANIFFKYSIWEIIYRTFRSFFSKIFRFLAFFFFVFMKEMLMYRNHVLKRSACTSTPQMHFKD